MNSECPVAYTPCDPQMVSETWGFVHPWIESALEYSQDEMCAEDIYRRCEAGAYTMWLLADKERSEPLGCFVTYFADWPRKRILNVLIAAGRSLDLWCSALDMLDMFAAQNGAEEIRFFGRPGLERVMGRHGFYKSYTVMSRDVGRRH